MAIQTTYPEDMIVAFEGAAADGNTDRNIVSLVNTAAESFAGRACLAVTGEDREFVQPTTVAGVFIGVLQHSHAVEQSLLTDPLAAIPVNKPGNVLRKGRINVVAEDTVTDVTVGVFYRHTSPGADPEFLGRFRTDADTADATLIPEARWVKTTSAPGELTIIEVNLP